MIWFICGIILTLVGLIDGYVSAEENDMNKKWCLLSFIFLLICVPGFIGVIATGEVGTKTRWGKVVSTNLDEGLHFKMPYEKIIKTNIKVQKIELETDSASKDLQDVNMKLAVNYRVDGTKVTELYKNVGTKYQAIVLEPAIQESIKAVTSKYTAEELITNRSEVSKTCMDTLQGKVKKYGLSIDNFNITNFNFSEEFNKAIEEKQVAEQKVLTARQELEKAKVDAEKKIVQAESEKTANELKQQTLTDNIIKEKFIDKWNGQTPVVMGDGSILDISSLIK